MWTRGTAPASRQWWYADLAAVAAVYIISLLSAARHHWFACRAEHDPSMLASVSLADLKSRSSPCRTVKLQRRRPASSATLGLTSSAPWWMQSLAACTTQPLKGWAPVADFGFCGCRASAYVYEAVKAQPGVLLFHG